jgi:hypothetical protein
MDDKPKIARKVQLKGAEKAARNAELRAAADAAIAEHEERERGKRENMEKLRAQRLASGPS